MVTKFKNRLAKEKSPYLQQHAENPVDWYPWGEEAFAKAREEDKPVFLSIGYSTCHWCHVMARESFSDEAVAALLNKHFIAIKVDKEERPDIDAVYMRVCQTLTGNGGWPLSIFMTPKQRPFLAATYFPKESTMNSIGFLDLLAYIADTWQNERQRLLNNADVITEHLNKGGETGADGAFQESETLIELAVSSLRESFDDRYGGFGMMPKFPTPQKILFLLERYETTKDDTLLKIAEKTLLQMYRGGLFDHIGGGFCRYSTDPYFLVPHFEKMLYDNALLILCYAKAYELTKKTVYQNVAKRTANYILKEMTSSEGGFYSAQDADSEGEEGKYYLFTPKEILHCLGEAEGKIFCELYDITEKGNFEERNIPNLLKSQSDVDGDESILTKLAAYRRSRAHLFTDDKVLTSWNGMMIAALAVLYRVSGEEIYLQKARTAARCIKEYASYGTTLLVGERDGQGYGSGFLDDYAYFVFALLELYEATLEEHYLIDAQSFCDEAITDFYDQEEGGFYLSGGDNEELIAPIIDVFDTAVPGSNGLMADNLLRLAALTKRGQYEELSDTQFTFMKNNIGRSPVAACYFLTALNRALYPPREITCVFKDRDEAAQAPLKVELRALLCQKDDDELHPLINEMTTYYVCEKRTCLPPTNRIADLGGTNK